MKTKVRLIIMSHLSDIQEGQVKNHSDRINFVKWLLLSYPNTNVEVDPDQEYTRYLKRTPVPNTMLT